MLSWPVLLLVQSPTYAVSVCLCLFLFFFQSSWRICDNKPSFLLHLLPPLFTLKQFSSFSFSYLNCRINSLLVRPGPLDGAEFQVFKRLLMACTTVGGGIACWVQKEEEMKKKKKKTWMLFLLLLLLAVEWSCSHGLALIRNVRPWCNNSSSSN